MTMERNGIHRMADESPLRAPKVGVSTNREVNELRAQHEALIEHCRRVEAERDLLRAELLRVTLGGE